MNHSGKCPFCGARLRLISPAFDAEQGRFNAHLAVEAGPAGVGQQFHINGSVPIDMGKVRDRPIHLPGEKVSRTHCRLVPAGEAWVVEDAGSRNGVYVNGRRIDGRLQLSDGDSIRVGEYTLRYHGRGAESQDTREDSAIIELPDGSDIVKRETESTPPAPPARAAVPQTASASARMARAVAAVSARQAVPHAPEPAEPGPTCPGCEQELPPGAVICVECGIDLRTGKPILTADETDVDAVYAHAEKVIWFYSLISPFWFCPVSSDALGTRKPWASRGFAIVTILISAWFLAYDWSGSSEMRQLKNLMLWSGDVQPSAAWIESFYNAGFGDRAAFQARASELVEAAASDPSITRDEVVIRADASLSPEQRAIGQFRPSQLLTWAFLHGGPLHLAWNLVFLLVFGSRVNALIGNLPMMVIYPLLAVLSGVAHHIASAATPPMPALGASGAVMGLAGMYLALMPVHNVHVAAWGRWGWKRFMHLHLKIFAIRGFWVVLFYMTFDVLFIVFHVEDQVAHWAHLGGFLSGLVIGLLLLVTRAVNARGGDVLTALLGQRAWSLIGRPTARPSPIARLF